MDYLGILLRWLHIVSGIMWVGLLFWSNLVFVPFMGVLDADGRRKVMAELAPRSLYFMVSSALWTWGSGILLLGLVFYHGQMLFPSPDQSWTLGAGVMIAVVFLVFFLYDALAKSSLGKNLPAFGVVGLIVVAAVAYGMYSWAGFGYRAYQIHLGAMFGTVMVMNGMMRMVPAQKKIFAAAKAGTPPDPSLLALITQRSVHNMYLSVPLVFTMINMHTVIVGEENWWAIIVVMIVAWVFVSWAFGKSVKVKGL